MAAAICSSIPLANVDSSFPAIQLLRPARKTAGRMAPLLISCKACAAKGSADSAGRIITPKSPCIPCKSNVAASSQKLSSYISISDSMFIR